LAVAQREDLRVVGRPLDPAIPAPIGIVPVAVVFAVCFVVLFLVADDIVQREAVMRGDKVGAGPRPAAAIAVNVGGADDARGHLGDHSLVALPEASDRVAVAAVPLGPAGREIAELITI